MPGIFWMIKTISGLGNLLECELHTVAVFSRHFFKIFPCILSLFMV